MNRTEDRLNQMELMIRKPSFRQNTGLGNEVGYFIFDYPPEDELLVRQRTADICRKYENSSDNVRVKNFDLYDIMMKIIVDKGYLEKCFEFESKKGFERVTKAVSNMLRVTLPDSLIVSHIKENAPGNGIIFITGIGKCYPILRSHTILNNLHQVIDHVPVVLFFPGKYDGQELVLFGEIKDDNYYRAFKLAE